MIYGREALAGELGVSGGFIPTYATHRVVGLTFRIGAQLPGGRAGPPGGVAKLRNGLLPRNRMPVLEKRLFPVFPFTVTALVHKPLELAISHFELIDPERGNIRTDQCRKCGRSCPASCAIDPNHSLR